MTTELAKKWEAVTELRRRSKTFGLVGPLFVLNAFHVCPCQGLHTPPPAQVQTTGKTVCRDTLVKNHTVLYHAVQELGFKVAVETLAVHIESFYTYCGVEKVGHLHA